ncbi:MAG: hypothetical protein AAF943_04200 [Pseudomonadota bacterium]
MKWLLPFVLAAYAQVAAACDTAVCLVDPETLNLTRVITFDGVVSGMGPGKNVDDVLPLQGATFGERFLGQAVESRDTYDEIVGTAAGPLQMLPGASGQNLSLVKVYGNTVLNGYGAAGYPRREAQGEGAIAVLFDEDQSALAFDLRGGEEGTAIVAFHRRDGTLLARVPVSPTGEFAVGFLRATGEADIAGFIVTNSDPQGIAIDTLRFGKPPDLS